MASVASCSSPALRAAEANSGLRSWRVTFDGGAGDDIIRGDAGNDTITGGAGDDTVIDLSAHGGGEITLEDFTSTDLDAMDFGCTM